MALRLTWVVVVVTPQIETAKNPLHPDGCLALENLFGFGLVRRAGMWRGDRLLEINGAVLKNPTVDKIIKLVRGLTERIIAADQELPLFDELVREDVRFHIAIMTAARNDLMKKEILRLHLLNWVVSGSARVEHIPLKKTESDARRRAVLAMHEAIYAAIERSDAVAAKKEMEFHLQELIDHSLLIMTRAESGVTARELTPDELVYGT